MFKRQIGFSDCRIALAAVAFIACSSGTNGVDSGAVTSDSASGGGGNTQSGTGGAVGGKDSSTDSVDCTPFVPAIPCAQGTSCPDESYCDQTQTPPVCAKLHCVANGAACAASAVGTCSGGDTWSPYANCPGSQYCMSDLCLAGVCASPVGKGSPCYNQYCDQALLCLGFPATCVTPSEIGGTCQSDRWCAGAVGTGASSADAVYCWPACAASHTVAASRRTDLAPLAEPVPRATIV